VIEMKVTAVVLLCSTIV